MASDEIDKQDNYENAWNWRNDKRRDEIENFYFQSKSSQKNIFSF
jgi:hypothetical protein